ncbi:MAG: hypothetical protein C3F19_11645 [Rhodocyclales bacterium]|jgi:hypothetical protein|nr:MAG: hypothetical protein C3F19_11645 [Rhodocyclales bacterium]
MSTTTITISQGEDLAKDLSSQDRALIADARRKWDSDATLRAEFCDNLEAYLAYERARASGKIRVLGEKQ